MTTSIYAASSIHSKSTLSRKYDIDTSAMKIRSGQDNFRVRVVENPEEPLSKFVQCLSHDVGRMDLPYRFMGYIRLVTIPFFIALSTLGYHLIDFSKLDSTRHSIVWKLYLFLIYIPDSTSSLIKEVFFLSAVIVYVFMFIYLYRLMNYYKQNFAPSSNELTFFIVSSRVFFQIFTPCFSYFFAQRTYSLLFLDSSSNSIIDAILSIVLMFLHFAYMIASFSIYNATPRLRNNDNTQAWFYFSSYDWKIQLTIFINMVLPVYFRDIKQPYSSFLFITLSLSVNGRYSYNIFKFSPFLIPNTNSLFVTAYFSSILVSFIPLLVQYLSKHFFLMMILLLALIVLSFFIFKVLMSKRNMRIILLFMKLSSDNSFTGEKDDLDPLAMAIQQLNQTKMVHFDKLGIVHEYQYSLFLRIGFLFKSREVENSRFIKWSTDKNSKADLVLASCQISYAIHSDARIMGNLEQLANKIPSPPINFKSFLVLFNHLRQELLTQLNPPLLQAVSKAKKSNNELLNKIGDFWGAVLKQKLFQMINIIPEISQSMRQADSLIQEACRNYPNSPMVLREAGIFYDKSLGDHYKNLAYQSSYNRTKKKLNDEVMSSDSSNSLTSMSNVENEVKERLEPWLAAQDAIQLRPSYSLGWIFSYVAISIIGIFASSVYIYYQAESSIGLFKGNLEPVFIVSQIEYSISRIPQLIRRKQLFALGEPMEWIEETGPPIGAIHEFLTNDSIIPAIQNHSNIVSENFQGFIDMCKKGTILHEACIAKSYSATYGGSKAANSSLFELVSGFQSSVLSILGRSDFNWLEANESSNVIYIFDSFDDIYWGLTNLLDILENYIINNRSVFYRLSLNMLLFLWGFFVLIIIPMQALSLTKVKSEIKWVLKLFFHIPKNEVSNLRWSMKDKKKVESKGNYSSNALLNDINGDDSESDSKILQIDNLATTSRNSSGMVFDFGVIMFLFTFSSVIALTFCVYLFYFSMNDVIDMSNSYVHSINIASGALASYVWTQEVFSQFPIFLNRQLMKERGKKYFEFFESSFNSFIFGKNITSITPASLLGDDVVDQYISSGDNVFIRNDSVEPNNGFLHDVYFAMGCDTQIRLLESITRFILAENCTSPFSFNDIIVYHYEHLLFCHLDQVLVKGRNLFSSKYSKQTENKIDQFTVVFVLLTIIQLLTLIFYIIPSIKVIQHRTLTYKSLLQIVSPEALLKTQIIMKWLSGSYSSKQSSRSIDSTKNFRDQAFELAFNHSKSGLVIANEDSVIVKVNPITLSLLQLNPDDIVGKELTDFIISRYIKTDKYGLSNKITQAVNKMKQGKAKHNKFLFNISLSGKSSQVLHLNFIIEGHPEINSDEEFSPIKTFSLCVSDRTKEAFQASLLETEKKKSEQLISSMLPPLLSKRIKDGEKDIAFQCPNSSILFTSIHNFTTYVSQESPQSVIYTISKLFYEFDNILLQFPAITRIRTNQDSYIVATGLFSDNSINTGQVSVDFALKLLEVATKISDSSSTHFQILIGISTGGPINCGVVGQVRPSFDIIGSIVYESYQLCKDGIPGIIQISESTYESIKFFRYNIRERGDIVVSNEKTLHAYLVSPQMKV